MSRGVLLDVPAAKGVERLEPGYAAHRRRPRCRRRAGQGHARAGRRGLRPHRSDAAAARGKTAKYNHDSAGPVDPHDPWILDHDLGAVFTDTYVYEVGRRRTGRR